MQHVDFGEQAEVSWIEVPRIGFVRPVRQTRQAGDCALIAAVQSLIGLLIFRIVSRIELPPQSFGDLH